MEAVNERINTAAAPPQMIQQRFVLSFWARLGLGSCRPPGYGEMFLSLGVLFCIIVVVICGLRFG